MTHEDLRYLELARTLVAEEVATEVRVRTGRSRAEFVASADGAFTVAALRAWEARRRRPRSRQGSAYGRALARCLEDLGADR